MTESISRKIVAITLDPMQRIAPFEDKGSLFHADYTVVTQRGLSADELTKTLHLFQACFELYQALDELLEYIENYLPAEVPLSLKIDSEQALKNARGENEQRI